MNLARTLTSRDGSLEMSITSDEVLRNGVTSKENADIVVHFLMSWLSLLADCPLQKLEDGSLDGRKPARVFRRFKHQLLSRPVRDSILFYASLGDALLAGGTSSGSGCSIGPFMDAFRATPIFWEYMRFRETRDPAFLTWLLSFCFHGKKLEYEDDSLSTTAFRRWCEVEDRISSVEFDEAVTSDLSAIARFLLPKPVEPFPFMGRHGPGAVADGDKTTLDKTHQLVYSPALDRAFFSSMNLWNRDEASHAAQRVIPDPFGWDKARHDQQHLKVSSERTSEFLLVRKDVRSMRSICKEPTSNMYFQQSYRWELERRLHDGPLGQYVNLRDQCRNQDLARIGSAESWLDTIDLSDASDSVSVRLVRSVFPRDVLYFLLATRSAIVRLPDGSERRVDKFAPMGSALCFPVQTILYSTVILRAMCRWYIDKRLWHHSVRDTFANERLASAFLRRFVPVKPIGWSRRMLNTFTAYGDDLICDYRVTDEVVATLTSLGFKVNLEKSFRGTQAVRESCGKFYWMGEDVTPLRYRIKYFSGAIDASSYESMVAAANNAYAFGYLHLRKHYIQTLMWGELACSRKGLRKNEPNAVRFVDDVRLDGVYSPNAVNYHIPRFPTYRRYNKDLQRDEVRCVTVKPKRIERGFIVEIEKILSDAQLKHDRARRLGHDAELPLQTHGYVQWSRVARLRGDELPRDFCGPTLVDDVNGTELRWSWIPA